MTNTLSRQTWFELLLLGTIWGGIFLATRLVLEALSTLTTVAIRTTGAALTLWLFVVWKGYRVPLSTRVFVGFLGMGLLNNVIPFGLMAWGQLHIASGLTAILNATTAFFGIIGAALFFQDEPLTLRRLGGVALGTAGVVAIIGPSLLSALDLRSLAQIAILAGTLSYALAGVWAKIMLKGLPAPIAAAGMLTASALITLTASISLEGPPMLSGLSPQNIGAIAYMSLIGTAGAYLLYFRVLAQAGSGNLMLVTLLIPPVAVLLGALVLDETLSPHAVLGFGLIAFGLLVIDGRILKAFRRV